MSECVRESLCACLRACVCVCAHKQQRQYICYSQGEYKQALSGEGACVRDGEGRGNNGLSFEVMHACGGQCHMCRRERE